MIDSHCHLDRVSGTPEDALDRARDAGVTELLLPGIQREAMATCGALAATSDSIWLAAGIHPEQVAEDVASSSQSLTSWLEEQCDRWPLVALGESGLDFVGLGTTGADLQQRQQQMDAFDAHLQVARERELPVIVHSREADMETLELLPEGPGGVIHCFTSDLPFARRALDLGYLISLSGIVTFPSAKALREVVEQLPEDGLLIETDSPWLAPGPMRGQDNEPAYLPHTAACVADLLQLTVDELTDATDANFRRLFGVDPVASSG